MAQKADYLQPSPLCSPCFCHLLPPKNRRLVKGHVWTYLADGQQASVFSISQPIFSAAFHRVALTKTRSLQSHPIRGLYVKLYKLLPWWCKDSSARNRPSPRELFGADGVDIMEQFLTFMRPVSRPQKVICIHRHLWLPLCCREPGPSPILRLRHHHSAKSLSTPDTGD